MMLVRYFLFLCGMLLCLSTALWFWTPDVFGFNRFKVRTTQENLKLGHAEFVKGTTTDDSVIAVSLANIRVGNGHYHTTPEIGQIFSLMQASRALISTNIMDLLKHDVAINTKNLDAHLRHLSLTVEKVEKATQNLQDRSIQLMIEAEACLVQKREWDSLFFQWIQTQKDADTQQWLAQSLQYAPCYITKRIESNAYSYMASYAWAGLPLLQKRKTLLLANRDMLLQYNGLFEWTLLDELQVLKSQVASINAPSSADMNTVFNLFAFTDTTTIPTYNRPRFDKIPTFQDPWISVKGNFQ